MSFILLSFKSNDFYIIEVSTMLNLHNIIIIWVKMILILIDKLLWLKLETCIWLNEFSSIIEKWLWVKVKTLIRINEKVWLISFLLDIRGKITNMIRHSNIWLRIYFG